MNSSFLQFFSNYYLVGSLSKSLNNRGGEITVDLHIMGFLDEGIWGCFYNCEI